MQLKFYARSGKAIGDGRDLEEVYYALDTQFVSNMSELNTSVCIGVGLQESKKTLIFLRPDVELVSVFLLYPYYVMFAVSLLAYGVIVVLANKFIRREEILDDQSFRFLYGFLICTSMLGIDIVLEELPDVFSGCFLSVHIISKNSFLLGITIIIVLLFILTFIQVCCLAADSSIRAYFEIFMFPVNALLFVRLFISIFPTILFGFAYPLNVFSLVVLHVALVFVFTVSFTAITSNEVIYLWNSNVTKDKPKKLFIYIFFVTLICGLLIFWVFVYACILMGYGVTVAQGYVTKDGASAVVSFVPSMVLFLIGWLIKWRFFNEPGRCQGV